MPGTKTRLIDDQGQQYALVTDSRCVEMRGGKTLADYEPVVRLVVIEHDLDAYPYVMLLHMTGGESATLIPAGLSIPAAGRLSFTPHGAIGAVPRSCIKSAAGNTG